MNNWLHCVSLYCRCWALLQTLTLMIFILSFIFLHIFYLHYFAFKKYHFTFVQWFFLHGHFWQCYRCWRSMYDFYMLQLYEFSQHPLIKRIYLNNRDPGKLQLHYSSINVAMYRSYLNHAYELVVIQLGSYLSNF